MFFSLQQLVPWPSHKELRVVSLQEGNSHRRCWPAVLVTASSAIIDEERHSTHRLHLFGLRCRCLYLSVVRVEAKVVNSTCDTHIDALCADKCSGCQQQAVAHMQPVEGAPHCHMVKCKAAVRVCIYPYRLGLAFSRRWLPICNR